MVEALLETLRLLLQFMWEYGLKAAFVMWAAGFLVAPVVVLVHELGHAAAALALGYPVDEVVAGNARPRVTLRVRGVRIRFGRIGRDHPSGHVLHAQEHGPLHSLIIAAAGPAASLAGAIVTGIGAWSTWTSHHWVSLILIMATGLGFIGFACVFVSPDDEAEWTDGRWIRSSLRALRPPKAYVPPPDPNEATSVPPPTRGCPRA